MNILFTFEIYYPLSFGSLELEVNLNSHNATINLRHIVTFCFSMPFLKTIVSSKYLRWFETTNVITSKTQHHDVNVQKKPTLNVVCGVNIGTILKKLLGSYLGA